MTVIKQRSVPADFDFSPLSDKLTYELTAMGYNVIRKAGTGVYSFKISKDIGGMDTFIGRWQRFFFDINEKLIPTAENEKAYKDVSVSIYKRAYLDKIICFFTGLMLFFIPWIFALIANGNRKNIEKVALKIVDDYIVKNTINKE